MREREARSVILVLDENLSGKSILLGLAKAGIPARPMTEFVHRAATDPEVFGALRHLPNHFLITKDKQFHRRPAEKAALMNYKLGAYVITSHKNKTGPELIELIAAAWPEIERFAAAHSRPFIAKILADGHVEKII